MLDLEFEKVRGRPRKREAYAVVRELREADLELLDTKRAPGPRPELKKLRPRHHALARAIAEGMTDVEAARVAGYGYQNVYILKQDPTFQRLIEFYAEGLGKVYVGMHERLAALGEEAVETLRDRLEEDPDEIPSETLRKIITDTADRTGFGPSSTNTQVNVNVNLAARLAEARKRVRVIEGGANAKQIQEAGEDDASGGSQRALRQEGRYSAEGR